MYQIIRTDKADEQLRALLFYLSDAASVNIALKMLDKIENAINRLKDFPYSGTKPHYRALRRQGFLVLIVERYLVFYKVNEIKKQVIIYAVFSSKQAYQNLI